jgi:hypothetical protein
MDRISYAPVINFIEAEWGAFVQYCDNEQVAEEILDALKIEEDMS